MKLISLNIEGHKHLEERVIPFLQTEQPDVVCLQELFQADIPKIENATGLKLVQFAPNADVSEGNEHIPDPLGIWGLGQFVSPETIKAELLPVVYYKKNLSGIIPKFMGSLDPNAADRMVLHMNATTKTGSTYHVMTTHFTWSPGGSSTPDQLEHAQMLLDLFNFKTTNSIFCGDFNAPRGRETFQKLESRWVDNIPKHYTTSLDQNLHKGGKLELMVDGLFSDPEVHFSSVRLQDGVSDHMAIVAEVV